LREIQELLRDKNIRTTVRYTHVGYEQTRQTAEALSDALGLPLSLEPKPSVNSAERVGAS
jgi:hypothetical protein